MLDRRILLEIAQAADIVHAETGQRIGQTDRAILHVTTVEHRQQTLARGGEIAHVRRIAVVEDDATADDDLHRGRVERGDVILQCLRALGSKADAGRIRVAIPPLTRNGRRNSRRIDAARRTRRCDTQQNSAPHRAKAWTRNQYARPHPLIDSSRNTCRRKRADPARRMN
jgi:hypothetical protein